MAITERVYITSTKTEKIAKEVGVGICGLIKTILLVDLYHAMSQHLTPTDFIQAVSVSIFSPSGTKYC